MNRGLYPAPDEEPPVSVSPTAASLPRADAPLPVAKYKPWPKDEWYKVEYELPRVQYGYRSGEVVVLVVNENGDYHVSADVYDHAEREWVSWGGAYKVVAWRALPWPERGDMLTVEWLESFEGRSDEPKTKEPPS